MYEYVIHSYLKSRLFIAFVILKQFKPED